jgi:hypothetical protein
MQHRKGKKPLPRHDASLASQKEKNINNKYESFSQEKNRQKTKQKKSLGKLFGQRVSPFFSLP